MDNNYFNINYLCLWLLESDSLKKYSISDLYGYDRDYKFLNSLIKRTLKHEHATNSLFSIVFIDEETIQDLNRKYRNIDRVTDVLSFAFEDNAEAINEKMRFLGEIYVCIPRMKEQAKEYGHSEDRELGFLVVHGLLHLLGYDHMNKEEEKVMFGLQELILNGNKRTRKS